MPISQRWRARRDLIAKIAEQRLKTGRLA